MARYKVLKSVAHNVGHSFTSLMNYRGDDYVMGHLLNAARLTGRDTLKIDFVRAEAGPPELFEPPITEVPRWYTNMFWGMVERQGSDRSLVQDAFLTLRYDIGIERPTKVAPELMESPYVCDVRITDIRGREYSAHFEGWWFPERPMRPQPKMPWWAKTWEWISGKARRM